MKIATFHFSALEFSEIPAWNVFKTKISLKILLNFSLEICTLKVVRESEII